MGSPIKPRPDAIALACSCNNEYVPMLGTALYSLAAHHTSGTTLDVYLLASEVSESSRVLLEQRLSRCGVRIHWHYVGPEHLPVGDMGPLRWSPHYNRLLISQLLPPDLTKVIYFDADILVLDDVEELWQVPLHGHIIAAVPDYIANVGKAIANYEELGLDPTKRYFNSGVMLINLAQWRRQKITDQVFACTRRNLEHLDAEEQFHQYDQYGLNVVLHRDWKELDIRWNYGSTLPAADVYIVHYSGHGKPWSPTCTPIFRKLFLDHLRRGGWDTRYDALVGSSPVFRDQHA